MFPSRQRAGIDDCSTDSVRVDTGAGYMIFGSLLFLAAAVVTLLWFFSAKKAPSAGGTSEAPLSGDRTVRKEYLGDGTMRVVTEYVDMTGKRVRDVVTRPSDKLGV